jgi:hypothetical protein
MFDHEFVAIGIKIFLILTTASFGVWVWGCLVMATMAGGR